MKRSRSPRRDHWEAWFFDETYRENIDVIWPVDGAQVKAYLKRRFDLDYEKDDEFGACCIEVGSEGRNFQGIALRDWDRKSHANVAMLAHEAFHAAEHILSGRGCKLVPGASTEPYAYLIESIMRRCLVLLDTRKPVPSRS